ncbi:hypothetical protein HMPREF9371_2301 [Neisseria shayeganii 871]|uniref:Uncharacterized protein n=1 Tax=Neisseria shayeganii 871 TaxID=1032488 RepID=G4CL10_9NEIS|nr:hypothetical protein HMPREF9371_2301 [Neisseria shayeganii 871]
MGGRRFFVHIFTQHSIQKAATIANFRLTTCRNYPRQNNLTVCRHTQTHPGYLKTQTLPFQVTPAAFFPAADSTD